MFKLAARKGCDEQSLADLSTMIGSSCQNELASRKENKECTRAVHFSSGLNNATSRAREYCRTTGDFQFDDSLKKRNV